MSDNEETIRRFCAVWSELDVEKIVSFFAEDGVYFNIPSEPVQGHEKLRAFIQGFTQPWSATTWEITNLVSFGDTVVVERLDRTQLGDIQVDLPCCGVFEMAEGKIRVWRDYFDMNTYTKAFKARV